MTFSLQHMLSDTGPIARRLGTRFELRPQQQAMIDAVSQTLATGDKLLVEAGTGVGKSFAYLLPAIERLLDTDIPIEGRRQRVVISTHTIALQEQLVQKDIPLLQSVIDDEFSAVLVKGRGNYVSIRRLVNTSKKQARLFADPAMLQSLHTIEDWAYQTTDGSLATLPMLSRQSIWSHVNSDSGNCMGRRCPTYDKCYYQRARRRMENADLLVVNHALFFSDLALRAQGVGFLPAYDHVILDEAHTIEDVASDHFGLRFSQGQVRMLLASLQQRKTGKGFLLSLSDKVDDDLLHRAMVHVGQADEASDRFFQALVLYHQSHQGGNGRIGEPDIVDLSLAKALTNLSIVLKLLKDESNDEADRFEIAGYAGRCDELSAVMAALIKQTEPDSVYWLDCQEGGAFTRISLCCSPIDVGPLLRSRLFEAQGPSGKPVGVVLTSATLATRVGSQVSGAAATTDREVALENEVGSDDPDSLPEINISDMDSDTDDAAPASTTPASTKRKSQLTRDQPAFKHIMTRLGFQQALTLQLGSPFDYQTQAKLITASRLPPPQDPQYFQLLVPAIIQQLEQCQGGAFVLFTSYQLLKQVADAIAPILQSHSWPMLVQGQGIQRTALLERFRNDQHAVLLGTDSFWQGVDVVGDALRCVMITKLPFVVPDRPLIQARMDRIKARGGNPFMQYALPEAILKFKQGFGRLIRSKDDTGTVVVFDSRMISKSYGKHFIKALPDLPVIDMPAPTAV